MNKKLWAVFGIVQALGFYLGATTNLRHNVLGMIVGGVLLFPGILVFSARDSTTPRLLVAILYFVTVIANAAVFWAFFTLVGKIRAKISN